jgi:ankyrin repeat protein
VEKRANIESRDNGGWTPLLTASRNRHLDIVRYLVEKGANIESENDNGQTPLLVAKQKEHFDIVKYLEKELNSNKNKINDDYSTFTKVEVNIKNTQIPLKKENIIISSINRNEITPINNKNSNIFDNTEIAIQNELLSNSSMNKNKLSLISNKNSYLFKSKIPNIETTIHNTNTSLNQDNPTSTENEKSKTSENILNVIPNNSNSNSLSTSSISEWKTIQKKLIMACVNGNSEDLDILVQQGADLSEVIVDGWSLLHIAVFKNKFKIVCYLLDHGLDINIKIRENGYSALEIACGKGYGKIVKCLLERGADLYIDTKDEYKLLQISVKNNEKNIVKQLMKKDIDVDTKDSNKWTALHIASRDNYMEIAEYLIANCHANVNSFDQLNNTPLHIASQYGNENIVQLLIINHAVIDIKNSEGWTPLHIACQYNNEQVIHNLIDNKANINLVTYEHWTPLHIAIYHNNSNIVETLLERNPDLNIKNKDGLTVMDIALKTGNKEIYNLMVNHISELENEEEEKKQQMIEAMSIENKNKNKGKNQIVEEINNKAECLINAIKNEEGQIDAINLISSKEMGLEYIDKYGWTALHWASYHGNIKIVKLLIENNVKIDRETIYGIHGSNKLKGKTAIEIAMEMGHKDIIKFIRKKTFMDKTKKTINVFKDAGQTIPFSLL